MGLFVSAVWLVLRICRTLLRALSPLSDPSAGHCLLCYLTLSIDYWSLLAPRRLGGFDQCQHFLSPSRTPLWPSFRPFLSPTAGLGPIPELVCLKSAICSILFPDIGSDSDFLVCYHRPLASIRGNTRFCRRPCFEINFRPI